MLTKWRGRDPGFGILGEAAKVTAVGCLLE